MTSETSPSLNQLFKALGEDPRYQLISAGVSVGLSPFFVFIFWVLAQTLSPWFWVLVAAAAVNFAYNIWLVVKHRRAFRQETPTEARLHAE